jgi:hypothetical protein
MWKEAYIKLNYLYKLNHRETVQVPVEAIGQLFVDGRAYSLFCREAPNATVSACEP